jgi:hypothetical protein
VTEHACVTPFGTKENSSLSKNSSSTFLM